MRKILELGSHKIVYQVRTSKKAKHVRITIYNDKRIVLTVPRRTPLKHAEEFLHSKINWLLKRLPEQPALAKAPERAREEYSKYKESALILARERLAHFNKFYSFKYNRISIRNQKTRWGSCSRKGNLNFSYRIALINPELADYIIVHELCHLKEFNHSRNFWALVEQTIPEWRTLKRQIRALE